MSHAILDRVSMEMASIIAAGLSDHPEWLDLAKENLDRWRRRNVDSHGLVMAYDEWSRILERPLAEIIGVLTDPGHEGQRLRQNSPFVGVIPYDEVWRIKERVRDEFRE